MLTNTNLKGVIESGMCIACGACCAADRSVSLALSVQRQIYQPTSVGGPEAASVCPAIEVNYAKLHDFVFGMPATGPLGLINSIFLAQSTNEERNRWASSGGLIKEAIHYLLASGTADGVISIEHTEGLEYSARIVRNIEEINRLPGSIYHNINLQSALELVEAHDERLGLVAIPCQLEGIYNYISKRRPELKRRIVFTIGLLCAWQYTRHSIAAICSYSHINPDDLSDVSYRGGDMIGKLRLKLGVNRELQIDRRSSINYQVAFDRYFNTPRCNVCINHTNFFANLVVGDSWMQSTRFTRTGISIAICRSGLGTAVMHDMEQRGQIVLHEVSDKELIESEGDSLVYGEFAYALADLLRAQGVHTPTLEGPNRGYGTLSSRIVVASFYRQLMIRQRLMADGRYRMIYWCKITREAHRMFLRYFKWFLNRVLRFKALTGRDRDLNGQELRKKFR